MSRKFRLWVQTNVIQSKCETIIELDDEDVPEDFEADRDFNNDMLDSLWDSGMLDWGFEEVDES